MIEIESPSTQDSAHSKPSARCIVAQLLVSVAGTLITLNISAMATAITVVIGETAVSDGHAISRQNTTNDDITISAAESSLYATLQLYTHFTGGVLGGLGQDFVGRRGCLLFSLIPQFCSWITLYCTRNVNWLYAQAILVGLSSAFSEQTIITYVGEIAHVELRGPLFSIEKMGYGFGAFYAFFLSIYFDWRTLALVSSALPIAVFLLLFNLPESPIWLLSKGKEKQCRESLKWLNGWTTDAAIESEFAKLQNYVNDCGREDSEKGSTNDQNNCVGYFTNSYLKLFARHEFVQPFKIVSALFLSSYLLSLRPAKSYFINLLRELGVETNPTTVMTVSAAAQILGSITLACTIRKFGKRPLTLFTFISTGICLVLFGLYSYAHFHFKVQALWIVFVLCGLIYYFSGYTLGGMPWFISAELFPQKIRGAAGGITSTSAHIMVTVLTQTFLQVQQTITITNVFYVYAGVSFVCCYYLWRTLPETENKSLREIEEYFKNRKRKSKWENVPLN